MGELRPIGTEFDIESTDNTSTDSRPRLLTYKVVDHVWCEDEYHHSVLLEKVECINIKYLPAPTFISLKEYK